LIRTCKGTRQALALYLSKEFPEKKVPGIITYSDGIPKIFGLRLANLIRESTTSEALPLRLLFTLLSSSRVLTVGKIPDLEPIISPVKGTEQIHNHVHSFWKSLGYRTSLSPTSVPRYARFRKYHFSVKAGPNGPALVTSLLDYLEIRKIPELLESIKILGGQKLINRLDLLEQMVDSFEDLLPKIQRRAKRYLRKLSAFGDQEEKVRVVAILDYFSQTCLLPLHQYLYRLLRRIPQDCTFDQGSFKTKIVGWTEFYSIDLTNATDRFPIETIIQVLKPIFPLEFLKA